MRISLSFCLLLIGGVLAVNARVRKGQMSKRLPLYRSLDEQTFDDEEVPIPTKPKLNLIKGRGNDAGESRLFKHLLLFNQLAGANQGCNNCAGGGGGGGGGNLVPYIIVNNPSQLTNVNTNVIPTVAPPTTTTTTGTGGTGTGGTGTGGTAAGVRMGYLSNAEALPHPVPLPTPLYQQRDQAFPQVIYGPPLKSVSKISRRGNPKRKKNTVSQNPFMAFANSFRRIQFL